MVSKKQIGKIASSIVAAKKKKKPPVEEFKDPDSIDGVEMSILMSIDLSSEFVLTDPDNLKKVKSKLKREIRKAVKNAIGSSLEGYADGEPRIGNVSVSLRGGPNTL